MKPDLFAFLFGLMIVPVLFMFYRSFLFNAEYNIPLFASALLLVIVALMKLNSALAEKPNFYLFLFCPFCDLVLLKLMLSFFRYKLQRDPKDTPRSISLFNEGLIWDRLFNFVFTLLCLIGPPIVLLSAYQQPISFR